MESGEAELATGLRMLMDLQNNLQLDWFKIDIQNMDEGERIQFIKDMTMALEDELHEMLGEIGWKPWATSRHINGPAALGEMIDALHFFANICLALWWTADESMVEVNDNYPMNEGALGNYLAKKYVGKRQVNAKRQEDGYDGVSSKCRTCHRELTELPLDKIREGWCTCGTAFTVEQNATINRKES